MALFFYFSRAAAKHDFPLRVKSPVIGPLTMHYQQPFPAVQNWPCRRQTTNNDNNLIGWGPNE
jgi:hypothetical protein